MLAFHEFTIARADSDADLDAVAELEARCFTNPWTREMLAGELARSDVARVYALRAPDSRVAAFCACWMVRDELHVNTLAVDFPFRRMGAGSHLMRAVMRAAARDGATRATLEVRASNGPARQLYERLGFHVAGVRRRYYTDPEEDALVLWHGRLADPEKSGEPTSPDNPQT